MVSWEVNASELTCPTLHLKGDEKGHVFVASPAVTWAKRDHSLQALWTGLLLPGLQRRGEGGPSRALSDPVPLPFAQILNKTQ